MARAAATSHSLNDAIQELMAARDEARLQAHLFSLDARRSWDELENSLAELEQRLGQSSGRMAETALTKTVELTQSVRAFVSRHGRHRSELIIPARAVMSQPVTTCAPEDTLHRAAQLLWDYDCGALPVVERSGRLAGMLTDRDICMAAFTRGQPLWSCTVESAMSRPVHCVTTDASVQQVLALMRDKRVRRVPVVNEAGFIVGLISFADLLQKLPALDDETAARVAIAEAMGAVCAPPEGGPKSTSRIPLPPRVG
ncbi:MAG TPA: CBS domain-containing protein [Polyangiaceae bacterium]|nr:CBS domain-containing protein [Polyangiaceae bacterium]